MTATPPEATEAQPSNLAEQAYRRLGGMILDRELVGGTVLIEERLAEQLSISRTPLREAMLRLAAEELLVKHDRRSFSVRLVSAAEFFQSHRVREWLEPEAIELARGKVPDAEIADLRRAIEQLATLESQERAHWAADDRLHLMFAEASGNTVLARLIRQVRVTTRLFEISRPLRRVRKDGEEHLAILDAFARDDIETARKSMVRHVRNLAEDTMEVLRGIG